MEERQLLNAINEAIKNDTFNEREKEKELANLYMQKSDIDMMAARAERFLLKNKKLRKNPIIRDYTSWDWVITKSYYSMYHSVLALLAKLGIRTKTHFITLAAFELFFVKKEIISKRYLDIFKQVKNNAKVSDEYLDNIKEVKNKRFTANYDVETTIQEREAERCLELADEFAKEMKRVFDEMETGS